MSEDTLRQVRTEGERLFKALEKELYLNMAGFKDKCGTAELLGSFGEFGDPGLFKSVSEGLSGGEGPGFNPLPSFAARAYLASRTSGLTDAILGREATGVIDKQGGEISYRASRLAARRERKKSKRERIESGRRKFLSGLEKSCLEKLDLTFQCVLDLGFASAVDMHGRLENYAYKDLTHDAEVFLKDTGYAAADMLGWFFERRMDIGLPDADINDLGYLLGSFDLRAVFTKRDLMEISKPLFGDMDLIPEAVIRLDSIKRRGKSIRPLCFPMEPARDVYISVYPSDGIDEYLSFFHVMGRAMSYAHTEPGEDFEFRYLREKAAIQLYSLIFRYVVYDPLWIKRFLKAEVSGDCLRMLNLHRLMSARAEAGRLIFQSRVSEGGEHQGLPSDYADIMAGAMLCRTFEHDYITAIDSEIHSAPAFKALEAEPALSGYLRERFDEQWWRSPEAGGFLKSLYREGGRATSDIISGEIAAPGPISLKELFERILA